MAFLKLSCAQCGLAVWHNTTTGPVQSPRCKQCQPEEPSWAGSNHSSTSSSPSRPKSPYPSSPISFSRTASSDTSVSEDEDEPKSGEGRRVSIYFIADEHSGILTREEPSSPLSILTSASDRVSYHTSSPAQSTDSLSRYSQSSSIYESSPPATRATFPSSLRSRPHFAETKNKGKERAGSLPAKRASWFETEEKMTFRVRMIPRSSLAASSTSSPVTSKNTSVKSTSAASTESPPRSTSSLAHHRTSQADLHRMLTSALFMVKDDDMPLQPGQSKRLDLKMGAKNRLSTIKTAEAGEMKRSSIIGGMGKDTFTQENSPGKSLKWKIVVNPAMAA